VLGIDWDPAYLAQARFAAGLLDADIEFRQMSVFDIGAIGERFDLVLFLGVLYHLRHPLLALDLIHEHVADDMLICQSMQRGPDTMPEIACDYPFSETAIFEQPGFPRMAFIEHSYSGDHTNWWVPNAACTAAMLRSAGFAIESHPESEIYICRRQPKPTGYGAVYPARHANTEDRP
jgi:tRNA (mo5U34)-methyltransferase